MTTQTEFFQQHAVEGVLPDSLMGEFLTMEPDPEGDSKLDLQRGAPDPDDEPAVDPKAADAEASKDVKKEGATEGKEPVVQPTEAELEAQRAPIQAKDGKHTIGFEKLEQARQRAADADSKAAAETARADKLAAELEALKKGTTQAADATGTNAHDLTEAELAKVMEGVDFGDYSDQAMAKANGQISARTVAIVLAKMPQPQAAATETVDPNVAHMKAIYDAHPDAASIHGSREMDAWLDSLPKSEAAGRRYFLKEGTTQDVIETFSAYKAATGKAGAADTTGQPGVDAAAAAQAVIDKAKPRAPTSLSEIPSGTSAAHNEAEAMLNKSATQLMNMFEGKSPEECERLMARVL